MKKKFFTKFLMVIAMLFGLVVTGGNFNEVHANDGTWTLVTDASTLAAGNQVVIASNTKGKVASATISSSIMGEVSATFSSDSKTISNLGSGAAILTLGGSKGAWTLSNTSEKKLGATAVKKVAWGKGITTWTIGISNSNATIQNTNSSYGRFLHNVSSNRFTTYTSNTNVSMLLPQIYRLEVNKVCEHDFKHEVIKEPTCTTEGIEGDVCTKCAYKENTTPIPARHNFENGVCECGFNAVEKVKALFAKYNDDEYVKTTQYFTKDIVNDEIEDYFHTKQNEAWRKTTYTADSISMVTSTDGVTYTTTPSVYSNGDNCVKHTGAGGNYTVTDHPSIDEWFVTLNDFEVSQGNNWTYDIAQKTYIYEFKGENGLTYTKQDEDITSVTESAMLKMAREFVAPMWLEPSVEKNNYSYFIFSKLTVEETADGLVMSLYATGDNISGKLTTADGLFSKATIDKPDVTALENATLSFANTAQRTEYSTEKQVWEQNGVKLTNNKAASTSNVGNYSNPVRLYANSEVIVEGIGMKIIKFECNGSSYVTALKNSIGTVDGAAVQTSGNIVTIEFTNAVDEFKIAKLTAQVQLKSITVNP